MNSGLLQIRWWQIRKELQGIGLVYVFVLLVLVFFASGFALTQYRDNPNAFLMAGLVAGAVLSLHIGRKDKDFILKHITNPARKMFLEYAVLTVPFTVPVLFTQHWWLFIAMQLAFAGIALLRVSQRGFTRLAFLSSWIAPADFEWLSGVRKSWLFLLVLYILAWATCWIMAAPLVCLWLFTVQVSSFYIECEPLTMLRATYTNGRSFIHTKIRRHSGMLLLVSLPVLVTNSIVCPQMWWINALFAGAQLLLLIFAVLLKYALYIPERTLSGNNILLGIAALSGAVPFLLPVPLLMNLRNYGRAIRNLKTYGHD